MRKKNPQKAFDKSVAFLKSIGIDTSTVDNVKVEQTYSRQSEANTLDLIGCIIYMERKGAGFVKQVCSQCNQVYAVEYMYRTRGMMCSDECRAASLTARGLFWDSTKPIHERWQKRMPVIVPPEALKVIEEINAERTGQESTEHTSSDHGSGVRGVDNVSDSPRMKMPDLSEFDL